MLDKTLKALLPITLIITIVQTFSPNGIFSFLNSVSMIITCITVYSLGWIFSSFVYNSKSEGYSTARHIGLASIFLKVVVVVH